MTERPLEELLEEASRNLRGNTDPHPTAATLALYMDGLLGEGGEEIMLHLGECRACTQALLYMEKVTEDMLDEAAVKNFVEPAAVRNPARTPETTPSVSPISKRRFQHRFTQAWALAASLACLALLLLYFQGEHRPQMTDLAKGFSADLYPAEAVLHMSEPRWPQIELPHQAHWLILNLNNRPREKNLPFEARLGRIEDGDLWTFLGTQSLTYNEAGWFTVVIPRDLVKEPAVYGIRLNTAGDGMPGSEGHPPPVRFFFEVTQNQ